MTRLKLIFFPAPNGREKAVEPPGRRHIKHKAERGLAVDTIHRYVCAIDLAAELCFRANSAADDLPLPKST
jgi:hypothetical protein